MAIVITVAVCAVQNEVQALQDKSMAVHGIQATMRTRAGSKTSAWVAR